MRGIAEKRQDDNVDRCHDEYTSIKAAERFVKTGSENVSQPRGDEIDRAGRHNRGPCKPGGQDRIRRLLKYLTNVSQLPTCTTASCAGLCATSARVGFITSEDLQELINQSLVELRNDVPAL